LEEKFVENEADTRWGSPGSMIFSTVVKYSADYILLHRPTANQSECLSLNELKEILEEYMHELLRGIVFA